mmetsp:Transcript_23214/g.39650  ORF Transcript_23214/g.39650 Transcript_23214/m.39650 type:complete len:867 (+) Transcript_23214:90-2690(+)
MATEAWRSQFPLRARGRHIVNQRGERFKFAGVNWYGASDSYHVVGGLDTRPLDEICVSVAAMGFSVVRLPFSSQMLRLSAADVPAAAIDYRLNPELRGLRPLEIFDKVVHGLGNAGVAVVLNNHTILGMWSGGVEANGLWYLEGSDEYTESTWIEDWLMLAERYRECPHVVAYDLRNEVRPVSVLRSSGQPRWASGKENDWARAAGTCAKAIVKAGDGDGLIIVERITWPQEGLGEMLKERAPWDRWGIPRDRFLLALHMYAWSGPGSWSPKAFTGRVTRTFLHAVDYVGKRSLYGELGDEDFEQQMDREWGFVLEQNICPVWLSEFGADLKIEFEVLWFRKLCQYLQKKDADFAYWPLNVGPKPGSDQDECYGFLTKDWSPQWADPRLRLLRQLCQIGNCNLKGRAPMVDVPLALDLHPWCAPLPGPLLPWPEDGFGDFPSARYYWTRLNGMDTQPGKNAKVLSGSIEDVKQDCIASGFGGFVFFNGKGYMREAAAETLRREVEVSKHETSITCLPAEMRLCGIWSVLTLRADWDKEYHSALPGRIPTMPKSTLTNKLYSEAPIESGLPPSISDTTKSMAVDDTPKEIQVAESPPCSISEMARSINMDFVVMPPRGHDCSIPEMPRTVSALPCSISGMPSSMTVDKCVSSSAAPAAVSASPGPSFDAVLRVLEVSNEDDDFLESCQRLCLRQGYRGFKLCPELPGCAEFFAPSSISELRKYQCRSAADCDAVVERVGYAESGVTGPQAEQLHVLETTLVHIGLQAYPDQDAFPGCNAWVSRRANLAHCRHICLEHGFGGFALFCGDAYFRISNSRVLQENMTSMKGATFYILTAEEVRPGHFGHELASTALDRDGDALPATMVSE